MLVKGLFSKGPTGGEFDFLSTEIADKVEGPRVSKTSETPPTSFPAPLPPDTGSLFLTDVLKKFVEDRDIFRFRTFWEITKPSPFAVAVVLVLALVSVLSIRKVVKPSRALKASSPSRARRSSLLACVFFPFFLVIGKGGISDLNFDNRNVNLLGSKPLLLHQGS